LELKNMKIEFSSALMDIAETNPSFDVGKLRIAYTGKNRNNTFISKESFERAIPTMFNCPVVANYIRSDEQIGSHDGEFIKKKDGKTKYVNITQPVGLVPESAQWYWETIEDNGALHQYLCTEVVLWKRQEAYELIKDSGITKQSMEIEVTNGEMKDDYYLINDFCFTAFCLLGTAEPCFESASLFTFSQEEQDTFKAEYTEMLKEFKMAFSSANKDVKEESTKLKLKELLEKYSVTEAELGFEVEGLSDEELTAKFEEQFEAVGEPEPETPEAEPAPEAKQVFDKDEPEIKDPEPANEPEPENKEDFALDSQLRNSLREAIHKERIETDWGSYSKYWMTDYDTDIQEVYFFDNETDMLYGCKYTLDGDDVIVDFENMKRKKFAIVDYVEGTEQTFAVAGLIQEFNEAYATAKVDAAELERLQAFEAEVNSKNREEAEKALFEKFEEKLGENEEFKALKEKASEFELDALEKELFVLVGKADFSFSFKEMSKESGEDKKKPMFGFESMFASTQTDEDKRMNDFMERNLNRN